MPTFESSKELKNQKFETSLPNVNIPIKKRRTHSSTSNSYVNKKIRRVLASKKASAKAYMKPQKKNILSEIGAQNSLYSNSNKSSYNNKEIDLMRHEISSPITLNRPSDDKNIVKYRRVVLEKDENLGYGFIAGSEKPLVVRFVSPSNYLRSNCHC